jgi:hypothetical protein
MFQAIFTSHQEYTQLLFQTDLSHDVLSLLSRQPQFGQKNTLNEDEIHAIFDQLEEKIGLAGFNKGLDYLSSRQGKVLALQFLFERDFIQIFLKRYQSHYQKIFDDGLTLNIRLQYALYLFGSHPGSLFHLLTQGWLEQIPQHDDINRLSIIKLLKSKGLNKIQAEDMINNFPKKQLKTYQKIALLDASKLLRKYGYVQWQINCLALENMKDLKAFVENNK